MPPCLLPLALRLIRYQCRAKEGFELQTVEIRTFDPSMLHQDLEGPSHPVRLEEMDGRAELRTLRVELADHLFHPEPHEKTHLIRKACYIQASGGSIAESLESVTS